MTTVVPVTVSSGLFFPSHHKRFIFKMFTFVDDNSLEPQMQTVQWLCSFKHGIGESHTH